MSARKSYRATPFGRWATFEERVERYRERLTEEEVEFVLEPPFKRPLTKERVQRILDLMVKAGIFEEGAI